MNLLQLFLSRLRDHMFLKVGAVGWVDLFYCFFSWFFISVWVLIFLVLPPLYFVGVLKMIAQGGG